MAGAIGIQLGGMNEYAGRVEERATLGDFGSSLTSSFIPLALQLMVFASFLLGLMLLFLVVLW